MARGGGGTPNRVIDFLDWLARHGHVMGAEFDGRITATADGRV
jgi:hypothetical protein